MYYVHFVFLFDFINSFRLNKFSVTQYKRKKKKISMMKYVRK